MPWPKHKNPTSNNPTAHAPYNFVPLPDKVVTVKGQELPEHDRYINPHYTGHIECSLTTESPLYIRCALTPSEFVKQDEQERLSKEEQKKLATEEKVSNKADFFYTNEIKKEFEPVIPGSSIRGMLRTLVEILSYSKVRPVSQQKLFYRAVADPTLGQEYRRRLSQVKAGYVSRKGDGGFAIIPARSINGRTFFKVREESFFEVQERSLRRRIAGFQPMYKYTVDHRGRILQGERDKENYKPNYYLIRFRPPSGRDNRGRPLEVVREIADSKSGLPEVGVVVCSGFIERKKKHLIVTEKSNNTPLDISESILQDYKVSLTDFQKTGIFDTQTGCLVENRPVFYLEQHGRIEWLGHTLNFRIPYRQENEVATPLHFVPEELRDPQSIDLAEAIFGWVTKESEGKAASYASRVFVTNARLGSDSRSPYYTREAIRPQILGSPKPTTFQHYLVQTLPYDRNSLKHYGSKPGQETVIRGHKLYWHKGSIFLDDIEAPDEQDSTQEEQEDTQHTLMRPLRPGLCFRFRIYFENLSDIELGALLWALTLPGDDRENYRHKIGMGKPLGMGAIKLEPKLYLTDRQTRSDKSGRYDRLFEDDSDWETGRMSVPECVSAMTQSIKAFEKYVLDQVVGTEPEITRLVDLHRIQALLRLLEWPGPEDEALTRYMSISPNEYRNRPVLPTPLPVLSKRGITRVRVKNYKSLADVDVRLGRLTILVGKNASGKSNFVDTLKFIAEAVNNLGKAVMDRGGIKFITRYPTSEESPDNIDTVSFTMNFEDDLIKGEYNFELDVDNNDFRVKHEICNVQSENESWMYEIIDGVVKEEPVLTGFSSFSTSELALQSYRSHTPYNYVFSLLSDTKVHNFDPDALRKSQRRSGSSEQSMDKKGNNLISAWLSTEESDSEQIEKIVCLLQSVVDNIENIHVGEDGNELSIRFRHDWQHAESPDMDARQESDGTLRMLAIFMALLQKPSPSLLAFEEPEQAIHPGPLRWLYRLLSETSRDRVKKAERLELEMRALSLPIERCQVMVTTHSPELLTDAKLGDIRVVEMEGGITKIGEIEEAQREDVQAGLISLDAILRKEGFYREP